MPLPARLDPEPESRCVCWTWRSAQFKQKNCQATSNSLHPATNTTLRMMQPNREGARQPDKRYDNPERHSGGLLEHINGTGHVAPASRTARS
jgi:hypothetical protein